MIISLIAAMDERRGIGVNNRLPWRQSSDLKRFKALTMGHHLIMGRKTYESIGRPLPGRTTIVVTRNPDYRLEGSLVASSLPAALKIAESRGEDEAFVIGGAEIFAEALNLADRLYLTIIHTAGQADVFFPEYNQEEWKAVEVSSFEAGLNNQFPHTFMILDRKPGNSEKPGFDVF